MQDISIPATDGYSLAATHFTPAEAKRSGRIVVISAALGVPRQFYRAFAVFLVEQGFDVITFDIRGNGGSRPKSLRGFEARLSDCSSLDAAGVFAWVKDKWPDDRLIVVGHSCGGQTLGLAPNVDLLDGFIAVAAIGGHAAHWQGLANLPKRLGFSLMTRILMPGLPLILGYYPGRKLGLADMPKAAARQWASWCQHPDYVFSDKSLDHSGYDQMSAPTLAFSFSDDTYVSPRHYKTIVGRYQNSDITWRHLEPGDAGVSSIGHFGFFKDHMRDSLWAESAEWMAAL